jgi:hypothetical protein
MRSTCFLKKYLKNMGFSHAKWTHDIFIDWVGGSSSNLEEISVLCGWGEFFLLLLLIFLKKMGILEIFKAFIKF